MEALPNAAAPVPDLKDGESGAGVKRLRELGHQRSLQFVLLDYGSSRMCLPNLVRLFPRTEIYG